MTSNSPERRETVDVLEGTIINGKFRIVSLLATGGMGRIYRAEQAPLGRVVAIKVLRTPASASETMGNEFRKRFFREASILSKLQHANVVTLFDYGRIEGLADERYFMAMEYLQGDTLATRLKKVGALTVQDSLRILRQIARGLREAHKLGAVHRDLKPSNIMLVPEEDGAEVVKILDFGIGKLMGTDDDQELTQEGAFLGSPKYIAPEQVNERRVDQRTDVYALGVIGFECLCGRVPFEGQTNLETILAHTNQPLPALADRTPGAVVPEVVESFVRRCLEKDPVRRPQSMEEVLRGVSDCERAVFGATSLGSLHGEAPVSQRMVVRPSAEGDTLALGPIPGAPLRPSFGTTAAVTRSEGGPVVGRPSRLPVVLAIGFGLLAVGGLAAVRLTSRGNADARAAMPAESATPPPPVATAAPRSFTLVLDSKPPGADVWDGDDVIGTTPMQVTVERSSVKDQKRRFVLRLEGYSPYTLLQGDSEGTVQVTAPLAQLPAAPSVTASVPPAQGRVPRWTPPHTATTATGAPHPVPENGHQAPAMSARVLATLSAVLLALALAGGVARADDVADEADLQFNLGAEALPEGRLQGGARALPRVEPPRRQPERRVQHRAHLRATAAVPRRLPLVRPRAGGRDRRRNARPHRGGARARWRPTSPSSRWRPIRPARRCSSTARTSASAGAARSASASRPGATPSSPSSRATRTRRGPPVEIRLGAEEHVALKLRTHPRHRPRRGRGRRAGARRQRGRRRRLHRAVRGVRPARAPHALRVAPRRADGDAPRRRGAAHDGHGAPEIVAADRDPRRRRRRARRRDRGRRQGARASPPPCSPCPSARTA